MRQPLKAGVAKTSGPGRKPPGADLLKVNSLSLDHLPMFPEVVIEALVVTKDPNAKLDTVARVIQRDPSLTTNLLRLANSPFYRTGRSIDTLEQAILRLGLRGCQNLIVTVSVRNLFRSVPSSKRQRCEIIWRHSFLTAALCRRLNEKLELGFQGQEFACGLCHDLGRILIAAGAPGYFDLADPLDFIEAPGFMAREQNVLGTDHCQLGAWFTRLNELPESLVATIEFHHTPEKAGEQAPLVALVAVADHMANFSHREANLAEYQPQANPCWSFVSTLWSEGKQELLKAQAPAIIKDSLQEADGAMRFSPS